MRGFDFKKILPYVGIILTFLCISYAFTPQVLKGKVVNQSDISSWKGMAHEIIEYNENNPNDRALGTNSMLQHQSPLYMKVIIPSLSTMPFSGEQDLQVISSCVWWEAFCLCLLLAAMYGWQLLEVLLWLSAPIICR